MVGDFIRNCIFNPFLSNLLLIFYAINYSKQYIMEN